MEMKKDFIEVYENAVSHEFCDKLIEAYEESLKTTSVFTHESNRMTERFDDAYFMDTAFQSYVQELNIVLADTMKLYLEKYAVLQQTPLKSYVSKLQKTDLSGGYHKWHFEQGNVLGATRIGVWSVFLNDVEEGGELEFLYLSKRIKAKKGTLCFFPASFTHTHRGNPPLSNIKYIATGWWNLYE